jgi:hypothetical protein
MKSTFKKTVLFLFLYLFIYFLGKLELVSEEGNKPAAIHCPPVAPVSYAAIPVHWHGTPLAQCTVRAFQLCKLHIQVVLVS